jgi:3-phenylpropionate/trans-cinnamate dioxygenase ferredoxin subunit
MSEYVKVASVVEIPPGGAKMAEVGGKRVAVFNVDGTLYAIDDTCTHRGGPLSEGSLSGRELTCPWHGAVFDVTTGKVIGPPAARDLASYRVRVRGEEIEVEIGLDSSTAAP